MEIAQPTRNEAVNLRLKGGHQQKNAGWHTISQGMTNFDDCLQVARGKKKQLQYWAVAMDTIRGLPTPRKHLDEKK